LNLTVLKPLNLKVFKPGQSILEANPAALMSHVQSVLGVHVNAARAMIPFLEAQDSTVNPSYTIVTGGLVDLARENTRISLMIKTLNY